MKKLSIILILCSLSFAFDGNECQCDSIHSQYYDDDVNDVLLAEYPYVNGKISGTVRHYSSDGYASIEFEYKNGNRNGKAVWLNENADTLGTAFYKNDKLVGQKKCSDGRKGDESLICD